MPILLLQIPISKSRRGKISLDIVSHFDSLASLVIRLESCLHHSSKATIMSYFLFNGEKVPSFTI